MIALILALLAAPADKLPKRADLSCFPCHSLIKFEKGPPFAHEGPGHRTAGHCHLCHVGSGHEGRAIDRNGCLGCHEEKSDALKILTAGFGKEAPPKAAPKAPHPAGALQCAGCHSAPQFDVTALSRSVHAKLACSECHQGYDFSLSREKPAAAVAPLAACAKCHDSQASDLANSVHAKKGGATCINCHGEPHSIEKASKKPVYAARAGMSANCIGCHTQKDGFKDSVHGRMIALHNDRAPGCANCHGSHDIAKVTTAASMVSPQNKAGTCAECHKGASANFAALFTHKPVAMRAGPHATEVAFSWLTAIVLSLLIIHVALDLGNEIRHALRRRRGLEEPHTTPPGPPSVQRFDKHQLIQHWLLIGSVVLLVLSDWPVRMAGIGTSLAIVNSLGGVQVTSIIHRFAGVVLGIASVYHLGYLTIGIVRKQNVFGMLPSMKDLRDLMGNGAYFLGLSKERPKFARFAYHEKFDYWAVFWGVVIMFGTGLMRWFPVFFAKFLPAGFIEGCQIAHGDEATLAALVLFTWHLYNVHLKPAIFPMNWTWIDGRIETSLLREEHRAEYDDLVQKGALTSGGSAGK